MKRAFTLIELLCVCALLTILAAILFPVFAAARDKARQTTCLSNVRQISVAQSLYIQDWDERLPHWYEVGDGSAAAAWGGYTFWTEYFQPYLRSRAVLRCPSFAWPNGEALPGTKLADYSLLTWGPNGDGSRGNPYWRWPGNMSLAQVRRPAEAFNLMDGATTTEGTAALAPRHQGGINCACLDGHARWLSLGEAFRIDRGAGGGYRYAHISADLE